MPHISPLNSFLSSSLHLPIHINPIGTSSLNIMASSSHFSDRAFLKYISLLLGVILSKISFGTIPL